MALVPIAVPLILVVKCKVVQFEYSLQEASKGLGDGWICPVFASSTSTIASPSFVSIFLYKLETSNVMRMQSLGTLPKFFSSMMKSVVSLMCYGSAPSKALRNSSTYADNFSI